MDDTTQSRTSDVAASAATRKRRSSILKSQRPPRTPFCELEFNVLTPTDTSKSRRVSFSKRTGVAEFATNEATTTWKNFYEEHNKSLESSGHDSAMNHFKQPIGHLGKRIFEQQFEEVEAIDFMGTLNPGLNTSSSINHINFAQLETTVPNLNPLQSKFELSALTEPQSKLFGDNLAITCTSEASGCIDVNFSSIQQIKEKDDLDDIQQDLQRSSNVVCQGPFTGQDLSEYIEVDLNTTHITIYNNESNMSITDTIHNSQVQEVSKSCSIDKKINISNKDWVTDKENILLNPYIAPRESVNFAITEMPDEVLVFDGKKLIIETENPKKEAYRQSVVPNPSGRGSQRKTIVLNCNDDLPNFIEDAQIPRNLLCFEGMPEMKDSFRLEDKPVNHLADVTQNKCNTIIFGDNANDISITQAAPKVNPDVVKQQTIIYNDDIGNMSITQAIPSNIMNEEKNRTIVYGNDMDLSITKAVPANVVISNETEKRKTVLFDSEACDISMTEAIPACIVPDNSGTKRRTTVLVDRESVSNSISNPKTGTQGLSPTDNIRSISNNHSLISTNSPDKIAPVSDRRTTIVFGNDVGNISITQALPSNIILPQKLNSSTYGTDSIVSMTQEIHSNILLRKNFEENKLTTVVYGDDTGNLSITQAVTKNQLIEGVYQQSLKVEEKNIDLAFSKSLNKNISLTQVPSLNQELTQEKLSKSPEEITGNKRQTIVFQNEDADISITQSIPIGQVIDNIHVQNQNDKNANLEVFHEVLQTESSTSKRRTEVFEDEDADISLTQSVTTNRVIDTLNAKKQEENYDSSVAFQNQQSTINDDIIIDRIHKENHEIPTINVILNKEESSNKKRSMVFGNNNSDICMTEAVVINQVIDTMQNQKHTLEASNGSDQEINKTRTHISDNNEADITTVTQAAPLNKVIVIDVICKENQSTALDQGFLHKRRTVIYENDDADISITQAVTKNKVIDAIQKENQNIKAMNSSMHQGLNTERTTAVFGNNDADISITQAITMHRVIDTTRKENQSIEPTTASMHQGLNNKRKTVVFEDKGADIPMTQTIFITNIIETIQKENSEDDETYSALYKKEKINEERIASDNADTTMSQAVTMNQVIDTTQNKNYNCKESNVPLCKEEIKNKRRTVVFENNEADLSMTEAVPKNRVIDIINKQNQNTKATTSALHHGLNDNEVVFVNNGAVLSANITLNQVISRQEEESKQNSTQNEHEVVKNETIHYENDMSDKTSRIVYDDDEAHISMTRPVSSSIILPDGQEKRRTIVVESVESLLENKHLLIEIEKLADDTTINKSKIQDQVKGDICMVYLGEAEFNEKKVIKCEDNNFHITKLLHESFSTNKQDKSCVNIREPSAMLSKPIPASGAAFQHEMAEKKHCQGLSKLDSTLLNATTTLTNVLVYQSVTANTQELQLRINKGDSQITSGEEKLTSERNKESSQSFTTDNSEVKIPNSEQVDSQHESNMQLVRASTSKHSILKTVAFKDNNSILNELLDMSESHIEGAEDKQLMSEVNSTHTSVVRADSTDSKDAMFYITRDPVKDEPIDKSEVTSDTQVTTRRMGQIQGENPLCIEYKDDDDPPIVRDVQKKLSALKNVLTENHTSQFKPSCEKLDEIKGSTGSLDMSQRKSCNSLQIANDTNELLEMLSDFSDTGRFRNSPEKDKEKKVVPKPLMAIENVIESRKQEQTRSNHSLKRQSTALSREDLLNNMSMASAALQKSRYDFDESDDSEEVTKTPDATKKERKSVTLSTDIVKTLQFDDDSITENTESINTPLKKTAFGEISYMKETKSKVIPSFLNDVSDEIKELMDDLVKPTPEVLPFSRLPFQRYAVKKNASTCSTQIQANLLTSSQIDLDTELYSTTNSTSDMNKLSSVDITDVLNKSMSTAIAVKNSMSTAISVNNSMSTAIAVNSSMSTAVQFPEIVTPTFTQPVKSSEIDVSSDEKSVKTVVPRTNPSPRQFGSVLVFDQLNPLNNVLLAATPVHAIDIHKYDPILPKDEANQSNQTDDTEMQEEIVMNQYRVEVTTAASVTQHKNGNKTDASGTSLVTKHMSVDQSTEPDFNNVVDLRDVEINTVIAMKGNEQLLQGSSSLTLVEDAEAARSNILCPADAFQKDTARSPVKVIFKTNEPSLTKVESDPTSTDSIETPLKPKKRVYSPAKREKHKHCTLASLELTPKPAIKMHKRSNSRRDSEEPTELAAERDKSPGLEKREKSPQKKSPKKTRSKKPGTTVTVQQLTTMVHVEACGDEEVGSSTSEPRSASGSRSALGASSSEVSSSFASSNNLRTATSPSPMEWAPASPRLRLRDARYGDDVMGLIDAMPFMGSEDCQWESVSGSAWSLLLLHARLRLSVVFGTERPRHTTPVLNIQLETLRQDKKNPIAHLCVTFAAEVMRHHMGRGCAAAGDLGRLVRRLAGVARLTAHWAAAMHDARARLAYSLTHDGWLALKVANTSYRTVWEVVMRVELVVEHERAAPWPRAGDVRVTRALAAPPGGPAPPDLTRLLAATPRDWGHAPRTIWKVFRYLKHKKPEDDFLHP